MTLQDLATNLENSSAAFTTATATSTASQAQADADAAATVAAKTTMDSDIDALIAAARSFDPIPVNQMAGLARKA